MTTVDSVLTHKPNRERLPGEPGIWVFISGDLIAFAIFFFVYLSERAQQIDAFNHAQAQLNQVFGVANTLLLLTASWFVVRAIKAAKAENLKPARYWLILAMICSLSFGANKIIEWSSKLSAGHSPLTNDFYMMFFTFTGVHFVHMVIGTVVLLFMYLRLRKGSLSTGDMVMLENGASFWHLVDLLWIVLFALLYLVHS